MTGEEGLEIAEARQPDLILLDLFLPGLHGDEVLRRVRANEATAGIPVILISADATDGQAERLLAQGYLTKPLNIGAFIQRINRTLNEAVIRA